MDNEATPVANDNTNVQPEANGTPEVNQTQDTLLGGNTQQQDTPPATGAPEAYDFKGTIPEGVEVDEALTKGFSDIARGMNLTNEQANELAKFGFSYGEQVAQAATQAVAAQHRAEVERWGEEAKQQLGADYDKVIATCGAGLEAIEKVVPNIRQALNETGAGNRIEIIRAMELVGQLVQGDPGKLMNVGSPAAKTESKSWYDHSNMS